MNDAIKKEDVHAVRQLVEQGASLDERDAEGRTPLHCAVDVGNLEIVQLLVESHANISAKDRAGNTPLHIAAAKGRPQAIKFLLEQGAGAEEKNGEGAVPAKLAAREGRASALEMLLNVNNKDEAEAEGPDEHGNTLLHVAAAAGQRKVVDLLIRRNFDVNAVNQMGHTPLDDAIENGRTAVAEALLAAGALLPAPPTEGEYDEMPRPEPLELALKSGNKSMMTMLLNKGATIEVQHLYQLEPNEEYAAKPRCISQSKTPIYLAVAKPGPNAALLSIGGSAFAMAIACKDRSLLEILMKRAQNISYGVIALKLPMYVDREQYPDRELFELVFRQDKQLKEDAGRLLQHYARFGYARYDGQPVDPARKKRNLEFVEYLLSQGADPNYKDQRGLTLLHEMQDLELALLLIKHGADVNAVSGWGNTPLHFAVLSGNIRHVEFLLGSGADPNKANELGNTPLHFAAARNMKDIAAVLIRKGAKINVANGDGNTPLHQAVRFPDNFDTASQLLRQGAKPNLRNHLGRTPLHCVALRDYYETSTAPAAAEDNENSVQLPDWQRPPLMKAAEGDLAIVTRMLVKYKADLRLKDNKGNTAYDLALANRAHSSLAALVEPVKPKVQSKRTK